MSFLGETVSLLELNPGEWDDSLRQCKSCGLYSDPEVMASSSRGEICPVCAENGEADS